MYIITSEKDLSETLELVKAVGLEVVESIFQSGKENPRTFFGSGRLNAIAAELDVRNSAHLGMELI